MSSRNAADGSADNNPAGNARAGPLGDLKPLLPGSPERINWQDLAPWIKTKATAQVVQFEKCLVAINEKANAQLKTKLASLVDILEEESRAVMNTQADTLQSKELMKAFHGRNDGHHFTQLTEDEKEARNILGNFRVRAVSKDNVIIIKMDGTVIQSVPTICKDLLASEIDGVKTYIVDLEWASNLDRHDITRAASGQFVWKQDLQQKKK